MLKGLFSGSSFSYAGEHYTVTDYTAFPVPVQRPHPPFFIGGCGRRTLTLAGREADIIGLAPRIKTNARVDAASLTWAATLEKIDWVRQAAGERFDSLEFNVYPSAWPVTVTDDLHGEARKVIDHLRSRTGVELTEDEVIESQHLFIGSVDRLVEAQTAKTWASSAKALNSRALPAGSRRNIVHCSPACPSKRR